MTTAYEMKENAKSALETESFDAVSILRSFFENLEKSTAGSLVDLNTKFKGLISENAGGLLIIRVYRAALFGSITYGHGIVVARVSHGWSAPVSVSLYGLGCGLQIGAHSVEEICLLSKAAIESIIQGNSLTFGPMMSMAVGRTGFSMQLGVNFKERSVDEVSYSKSLGLFGGSSLEGHVVRLNKKYNEEFYGGEGFTQEAVFDKSQVFEELSQLLKKFDEPPAPKPESFVEKVKGSIEHILTGEFGKGNKWKERSRKGSSMAETAEGTQSSIQPSGSELSGEGKAKEEVPLKEGKEQLKEAHREREGPTGKAASREEFGLAQQLEKGLADTHIEPQQPAGMESEEWKTQQGKGKAKHRHGRGWETFPVNTTAYIIEEPLIPPSSQY
jgi:lipid-binding SYLF domain-containing protein